MDSSNTQKEPVERDGESQGIARRALVKGAAWSVPTVALAVAAPLASASDRPQKCDWGNRARVDATDGNTNSRNLASLVVAVPQGTKQIRFTVAGGSATTAGMNGRNQGVKVWGNLPGAPYAGMSLYLVAGSFGGFLNGSIGGVGWGNGGSGRGQYGQGGGGGSALAISGGGGMPNGGALVVAGGGGGGSGAISASGTATRRNFDLNRNSNAGLPGNRGNDGWFWERADGASSWGGPGSGAGQSSAGDWNWGGGYTSHQDHGTSGSGRDGGYGSSYEGGAGGGGGGYYGGGGGTVNKWNGDSSHGWSSLGGAGGGGGSFITSNALDHGAEVLSGGRNGWVEVEFYVCR